MKIQRQATSEFLSLVYVPLLSPHKRLCAWEREIECVCVWAGERERDGYIIIYFLQRAWIGFCDPLSAPDIWGLHTSHCDQFRNQHPSFFTTTLLVSPWHRFLMKFSALAHYLLSSWSDSICLISPEPWEHIVCGREKVDYRRENVKKCAHHTHTSCSTTDNSYHPNNPLSPRRHRRHHRHHQNSQKRRDITLSINWSVPQTDIQT